MVGRGQRRSSRDETWSASLWQTFFSASIGAQIPVISEKLLRLVASGFWLRTCVSRKFQLDPLGDHPNTCTVHSGVKKGHEVKWHVRVRKQSCKQGNRLILWASVHQDNFFAFFFPKNLKKNSKILKKYDLNRPKVSKYSRTS